MRKLRIVLALLAVAAPVHCATFSKRIDAATTNITGTFQKVAFTRVPNQITGYLIDNRSAKEVVLDCGGKNSAPAATDSDYTYVDAGETWSVDDANAGNACWIKTFDGTTLSTGVVVVKAKGY